MQTNTQYKTKHNTHKAQQHNKQHNARNATLKKKTTNTSHNTNKNTIQANTQYTTQFKHYNTNTTILRTQYKPTIQTETHYAKTKHTIEHAQYTNTQY